MKQFSALKEKRQPSKAHLRGAIALVNNLDAQQRDSVSARTLANAVQMQVVRFSFFFPSIFTFESLDHTKMCR